MPCQPGSKCNEPTPLAIVLCPPLARRSTDTHLALERHAVRGYSCEHTGHVHSTDVGQPGRAIVGCSGHASCTAALQHLIIRSGCSGIAAKPNCRNGGPRLARFDDDRVSVVCMRTEGLGRKVCMQINSAVSERSAAGALDFIVSWRYQFGAFECDCTARGFLAVPRWRQLQTVGNVARGGIYKGPGI